LVDQKAEYYFFVLQVHLGEPTTVDSVAVSISPGSFQHFTIFVIGGHHIQTSIFMDRTGQEKVGIIFKLEYS
jgi:hypothetical protein